MNREESTQRNRYTRELSRYLRRMAALLADPTLEKERFATQSTTILKKLQAIEPTVLYSGQYIDLLAVVNGTIEKSSSLLMAESIERGELQDLSIWLQRQLNQLEKGKRKSTYQRNKQLDDGEWE